MLTEKMHAKQIETFSKFRFIMSVLLLLVITGALGRIIQSPKNIFVLEGARAEFTCCSNVHELIFWSVKAIVSLKTADINGISGLIGSFLTSGRYNVTNVGSPGCYRLTITDVKLEDVGTYLCVDGEGLGQKISCELVILESFDCQEVHRKAEYMGVNNFGLPHDVINIVCISNYFGNIPLNPTCEWSSGNQILDNHQHVTETNSTVTLNIKIPASKHANSDQFSCFVEIGRNSNDKQNQTAWKSAYIRVNYALFQQRAVSECSVDELSLDCQPPCYCNTVRFSNGSRYCEIVYPSHSKEKFYVSVPDQRSSSTPAKYQGQSSGKLSVVIAVFVTLLTCGLAAAAATIAILRRKISTLQSTDNNGRPPEAVILNVTSDRDNDGEQQLRNE